MGEAVSYSSAQVTEHLTTLACHAGDIEKTAEETGVPPATLRHWSLDSYSEQYRRLERQVAERVERDTIAMLREHIKTASMLEAKMLQRVGQITREDFVPNALRAIADSKSKATTELLQLTGRPVNGSQDVGALVEVVKHLADRGLVSMAQGVSLEPVKVENVAGKAR